MESYDFIVDAERSIEERIGSARGLGVALGVERANRLIQQQATADLRDFDLTYAGWQVLTVLAYSRKQVLPAAKLAKRLGARATTLTGTVDRLERAGLVTRDRPTHDRRLVLVGLTEEGAEVEHKVTAARAENSFGAKALTDVEMEQLTGLLRKIRFDLGDLWQDERRP